MSRRKEGSRMSEDKELVEGMWKDEVEGEDLQDSLEGLRKADFSDIESEGLFILNFNLNDLQYN